MPQNGTSGRRSPSSSPPGRSASASISTDDEPGDLDIDIYETESLRDLALQFARDGLFGDIPERLQSYLDYDAIGRDLGMDYAETSYRRA